MFLGLGIRRSRNNKCLDVLFPKIIEVSKSEYDIPEGLVVLDKSKLDALSIDALIPLKESLISSLDNQSSYSTCEMIAFSLESLSSAVNSTEEAFFKLQCLSQRLKRPHELNLDSVFGKLNNLAWTNYGPILIEDLEEMRLKHFCCDVPLSVSHIDKFPYLVDYYYPSGTRITSNSTVRLGAYLGEGTTVMPAGYINFNAGTAGTAMIEGRVSAGVFVGDKSDIGGGASIMGTLSGGNNHVVSVGEQCLIGANAGTGISLGDGCTIAAGTYIYSGMKVYLYDKDNNPINLKGEIVSADSNIVKAIELNGRSNMLFIRDGLSGKMMMRPNSKVIELNQSLHSND